MIARYAGFAISVSSVPSVARIFALCCAVTGVLLLSSCGYRLSGTGSLVPEGAKTIAVPAFINNTNEPYVDVEITRAVTDEFIADGRLRVADVESADLALRGKIVKYEVIPLSYTPDSFVQQYRVRLVVDASLEDLRSRKELWKETGIESVFISDYPVTVGDIRTTRIVKETAIKKASQDIAWTLRSRVLEGF
jgi:outer membrane lipopolysaccharide assembly protein LptE/RlpB